jgi:uncharacterized protein (TIGR00156 family)
MKAIMARLALAALLAAAAAFAASAAALAQGGGGFSPGPDPGASGIPGGDPAAALAPGEKAVTVREARAMPHNTQVILAGNFQKRVDGSEDSYVFTDGADEIVVEVDDDEWNGVEATPGTPVLLYGEVDRDGDGVGIDVTRVSFPSVWEISGKTPKR